MRVFINTPTDRFELSDQYINFTPSQEIVIKEDTKETKYTINNVIPNFIKHGNMADIDLEVYVEEND